MHRIDSAYKSVDKFGAGKHGWTEGDPGVTAATETTDDFQDAVQEELCNVIESNGVTLVKGTRTQLLAVFRQPVGVAGGGIAIDATGGTTDGVGLKGTGGSGNGNGVEGVGTGTAYGVQGTASGTNNASVGVLGQGDVSGAATTSDGVKGVGAGTDGHGVIGQGVGTGAGVHGISEVGGYGVEAEHQSSVTNATQLVARVLAKSSANMVDSFGAQLDFALEDDASGVKVLGGIRVQRDGADNTAVMIISTGDGTDGIPAGHGGLFIDSSGGVGVGGFDVGDTLPSGAALTVDTGIGGCVPSGDNAGDLGDTTHQWRRAYIADFIDLGTGYMIAGERSDPSAPAANHGVLYFKDSGGGKTQLVVRFNTGAVQVVATEP